AAGLPAQVPVPPLEPDSADGRRIVLRGSVRAEQLRARAPLPVPPRQAPARSRAGSPVRPAPASSRSTARSDPGSSNPALSNPALSNPVWSKAGPVIRRRSVRAPVRLTTRGRVVVVTLLVVPALVVLSLLFRGQVDATGDTSAPPSYRTVVVQPGESLWTIATRIAPDRDPRSVIYQIRQINGLSSGVIQVGQRLAVPAN
ncbi:MAG: LysM peptidoglycan-binding domain-containing protein, partial [Sporichthyaceae bacterium]|nr:LysM peptidoglycan-binding domain-containing protein [Sporichthyaceae bacterium]